MDNNGHVLHPLLETASLDKAAEMANSLVRSHDNPCGIPGRRIQKHPAQLAADLSYMLEYLRLNFDLVPKE